MQAAAAGRTPTRPARAGACASSEWPPRSKKSSVTPIGRSGKISRQSPSRRDSDSSRGGTDARSDSIAHGCGQRARGRPCPKASAAGRRGATIADGTRCLGSRSLSDRRKDGTIDRESVARDDVGRERPVAHGDRGLADSGQSEQVSTRLRPVRLGSRGLLVGRRAGRGIRAFRRPATAHGRPCGRAAIPARRTGRARTARPSGRAVRDSPAPRRGRRCRAHRARRSARAGASRQGLEPARWRSASRSGASQGRRPGPARRLWRRRSPRSAHTC